MSATDRSRGETADGLAGRLREAGFVRLVAAPDGDALAATGLLARAVDGPFQAGVSSGAVGPDDALTVTVGREGGDVALTTTPLSAAAHDAARQLGGADPVLALAGVVAGGGDPGAHPELLEAAGADAEPGVGIPVRELADGLAHTTLVHAPYSGEPEAAARTLAGLDRDGRTVASAATLSALGDATARAAEAVEVLLRPYAVDGPFATVEGYADVLSAVAAREPGTGVALALGYDATREAALDAWREHARRAHAAVRDADPARHRGLVVAELPPDAPARTTARLLRDYRSPEPVVATVTDESVAVAGTDPVVDAAREAAAAIGESVVGRGRLVAVPTAEGDADAVVDRLREVVA